MKNWLWGYGYRLYHMASLTAINPEKGRGNNWPASFLYLEVRACASEAIRREQQTEQLPNFI